MNKKTLVEQFSKDKSLSEWKDYPPNNQFKTMQDLIKFVDNIKSDKEAESVLDIIFKLNQMVKTKKQDKLIGDLLYKTANWKVL